MYWTLYLHAFQIDNQSFSELWKIRLNKSVLKLLTLFLVSILSWKFSFVGPTFHFCYYLRSLSFSYFNIMRGKTYYQLLILSQNKLQDRSYKSTSCEVIVRNHFFEKGYFSLENNPVFHVRYFEPCWWKAFQVSCFVVCIVNYNEQLGLLFSHVMLCNAWQAGQLLNWKRLGKLESLVFWSVMRRIISRFRIFYRRLQLA